MADTTARILQLLGLLQARAVWSGPELAARLEVTTRSVRRDVERLRALGYPVSASQGLGGGYQLGAGRALPPLLLDGEEAVAVAVCLRLAAGGTVAGVGEAAVRTMAKLDQVLPARLRAQVAAVRDATVTVDHQPVTVDPDALMLLARSIRDSCRARFDYTAREGAQTARRVEPYRLIATGRRWYLLAFDLERDDWRSFRLDRMAAVSASTLHFTPREAPDAEAYVRRSRPNSWRHTAVVRVEASAEEAADQIGSWGELRAVDAHNCELSVGSDHTDALAWWLLRMPFDFIVLEGDAVREELRRLAGRAAHAGTLEGRSV